MPDVPRRRPAAPLGDRVSRGRDLARFGAGAGAGLVGARLRDLAARGRGGAGAESAFHAETAAQAAELLGSMKGLAMKLGQIASFVDVDLPDDVRDAYRQELAALRAQAAPVAEGAVDAVVEEQYGAPPDRAFAEWDPQPLASASIGQVHRAVLPDGQAVAVKVQHQGIAEAIEADLDNVELLAPMVKLISPNLQVRPLVAELRDRMSDELDYQREAEHQHAFALRYDGHPFIRIPRVHLDWCRPRVLVTELVAGRTFEEVAAADEATRQRAAEAIFRFAFGSVHRFRLFNGDPHPGNYLFPADGPDAGKVIFLDFGSVKAFSSATRAQILRQLDPLVRGDAEALVEVFAEAGFLPGGRPEPARLLAWFRLFNRPIVAEQPFTYTAEWAREVIAATSDPRAGYLDMIRTLNLPPDFLVLNRIQWGINSVLAALGARGPWRAISEEWWHGAPPATPMGEEERAFVAASPYLA
jgi:predicted unusual protein kinase regulating ubiquinone biosynthesis (AarF/ABC1/UbiB family)